MARAQDPNTSHAAALTHTGTKLSERRKQVYDLVGAHPGKTSGELGRLMFAAHPDLPMRVSAETPHKRLPELEKLGLIERGERRKCSDSGYECETWNLTPRVRPAPEQGKLI